VEGVVPDVIAYNAVISACEKAKQPVKAMEFFERLKCGRIVPDVVTYNALISACEKGKQPKGALELFEMM